MEQKTALNELIEIAEEVAHDHKAVFFDGSGTFIPSFDQSIKARLESVAVTPAQASLLIEKSSVTLRKDFERAMTGGQPDHEKFRAALAHAVRDPLVKMCYYFNIMKSLQERSVALDEDRQETMVGAVRTFELCLSDIVSNYALILPPRDKKDDVCGTVFSKYESVVLPKLAELPARLAKEFGFAQDKIAVIFAQVEQHYDEGKEHLRRIAPEEWHATL